MSRWQRMDLWLSRILVIRVSIATTLSLMDAMRKKDSVPARVVDRRVLSASSHRGVETQRAYVR